MLAVVRNTVGWHIERRTMSCRYLSAATGISPGNVSTTLKQLHQGGKGWLLVDNSSPAGVISLNVEAIAADMKGVPETGTGCSEIRIKTVPESGTNKQRNY